MAYDTHTHTHTISIFFTMIQGHDTNDFIAMIWGMILILKKQEHDTNKIKITRA